MSDAHAVLVLLVAIREAVAAERRPALNTESYAYRQVVTIPAKRAGLTEPDYIAHLAHAAALAEAGATRERAA